MFRVFRSELFLYGGIAMMAAAAVAAIVFGTVFVVKGRKLKEKLEEEYGKLL